jgi:hypothetical protein
MYEGADMGEVRGQGSGVSVQEIAAVRIKISFFTCREFGGLKRA